MQESSTYLAFLEEGEEQALKKAILRLGRKEFGAPDGGAEAKLAASTDDI